MSEITTIIAKEVIASPEFNQALDRTIEQRLSKLSRPAEYFTKQQLATLWKVSKQSIDRMSPNALKEHGFSREKIGVSVRFKKII